MNKDLKELATLQPLTKSVHIASQNETIEVKPLKFKQLLKALQLLNVMAGSVNYEVDERNFIYLIAEHPDEIIDFLVLALGKDREYFDNIESDEGVELAVAVWQVNQDFFVQKLAPKLKAVQGESEEETQTSEDSQSEKKSKKETQSK